MQFFRYKEDRIPVLIITLMSVYDLLIYLYVESIPLASSLVFLGMFGKVFVAAWNHHHQHVHTFKQRPLNRLLEIIYTFHTGVTINVWVLHHNLGHHVNYLDQEHDESGWTRKDGSQMGIWEYTFTIAITGYWRSYCVGKKHRKYLKDFWSMGVLSLFLLIALFYFNPVNALIVYLVPMRTVYLGTCWTTYHHHAGLETDDPFHASHNVTHKYYNILTGNLGLHTAHHYKQSVHWSRLPELHESIKDKIPDELIEHDFPGIIGVGIEKYNWIKDKISGKPSYSH